MSKTAVAVKAENTAVAVPSFMQNDAGKGLVGISAADMEIPRIKLLQALSPEMTEFDNLKQGTFFHSVLEEGLGRYLTIVPIHVSTAYILWNPREAGGGILARADDGVNWDKPNQSFNVKIKGGSTVTWRTGKDVPSSDLIRWGSYNPSDKDSQPAATKMVNIVAYIDDLPNASPAVITLQRSSIKVAQKFLAKLSMSNLPSFGQKVRVEAVQEKNDKGDNYYNYRFSMVGLVTDEGDYNLYKGLFERFKEIGVKLKDIDGLSDEERPAPTSDHY